MPADGLLLISALLSTSTALTIVVTVRRWWQRSPRRLRQVAEALGVQVDLREESQGRSFHGRWHGLSTRISAQAFATRVVVALPHAPTDIVIKPRDLDPGRKRMTVPEARFRERIAAHGDPIGLHGVLTPALREALAQVNASLSGPRVWIEDGRLNAHIPARRGGGGIERVAPYLNRILRQLNNLPASPGARLLARVQDDRENVTMRARALRLVLYHGPAPSETQAALTYAQRCGIPELEGVARAAVSQDTLHGRLSIVEPEDEEGALSLSDGEGGLALMP